MQIREDSSYNLFQLIAQTLDGVCIRSKRYDDFTLLLKHHGRGDVLRLQIIVLLSETRGDRHDQKKISQYNRPTSVAGGRWSMKRFYTSTLRHA